MTAAQFCTAANPLANISLSVPTTVPLSSVLASPRFRGKLPTPPAGSAELIDASPAAMSTSLVRTPMCGRWMPRTPAPAS